MAKRRIWGYPNEAFTFDDSGLGGGGGLLTVTLNQAQGLMLSSMLRPGVLYRIVGYRSVNWLHGFNVAYFNVPAVPPIVGYDARQVHVGDVEEVIILLALTPNRFEQQGWSETYGDTVWFNPLCRELGVPQSYGNGITPEGGSVPISGFELKWDAVESVAYFDMPVGYELYFGHVLYVYFVVSGNVYEFYTDPVLPGYNSFTTISTLTNGNFDVIVSADGKRVVLVGVTQADVMNQDIDGLYVESIYKVHDAYGYIMRRRCEVNVVDAPIDWRHYVYRRFLMDFGEATVNPGSYALYGVQYAGIGWRYELPLGGEVVTNGDYADYKVFSNVNEVIYVSGSNKTTAGYWVRGTMDNVLFSLASGYVRDVRVKAMYFEDVTITEDAYHIDLDVNNFSKMSIIGNLAYAYIRGFFSESMVLGMERCDGFMLMNRICSNKIFNVTFNTTNTFAVQDLTASVHLQANYTKRMYQDINNVMRIEYYPGSGNHFTHIAAPF